MKKLLSILLVIPIAGTMLSGCGTLITDMVEDYELWGIEDNTIFWNVYFKEDYDSTQYSYTDFIDVIKECMARSGAYTFSEAAVSAYDGDGYTTRFYWDSYDNPYIIVQKDGTVPNLRTYEWNLTTDEVNEIWDSIGDQAEEIENVAIKENENIIPEDSPIEITLDFSFGTRTGDYYGEINDDGIPNGEGTFSSVNSAGVAWTYTGEWDNGHWNGYGVQTWEDGTIYEGKRLNDLFNDYGEYTFASGNVYKGNFEDGTPSGEGTYYYADGSRFEGIFTDGANATGLYYNEYGFCYEATLSNGHLYEAKD